MRLKNQFYMMIKNSFVKCMKSWMLKLRQILKRLKIRLFSNSYWILILFKVIPFAAIILTENVFKQWKLNFEKMDVTNELF